MTQEQLGLDTGILIANPIPKAYAMDPILINQAIDQAILEMEEQGIKGKETTPYLLGKIVELTGGQSLKSNIQLVYNNCNLAAQISVALRTKETNQR